MKLLSLTVETRRSYHSGGGDREVVLQTFKIGQGIGASDLDQV